MGKIITVSGRAGAGKDSVVNELQRLSSDAYNVTRFAAPLKAAACRLFGPQFDDRDAKEIRVPVLPAHLVRVTIALLKELGLPFKRVGPRYFGQFLETPARMYISPREYQQILGTEVVRTQDQDAWVKALQNRVLKYPDRPTLVADARFHNEVDHDGIRLFVYNPYVPKKEHESEALANRVQEHIYNLNVPYVHSIVFEGLCYFVVNNIGDLDYLNSEVKVVHELIQSGAV